MRVLINCDDYGLTPGCNEGIIRCLKYGIARNTSMIVNTQYFEESINRYTKEGFKTIGFHLNLTQLKPVSDPCSIPTLVNENGEFWGGRYYKDNIDSFSLEDFKTEFYAQYEKLKASGVTIDHIDGHHACFYLREDFAKVIIEFCVKEGLKVPNLCRGYLKNMADVYGMTSFELSDGLFGKDQCNLESFIPFLEDNKKRDEILAFFSHPAIVDEELKKVSFYVEEREQELEVLTSNILKKYLFDNNIEVLSYSDNF